MFLLDKTEKHNIEFEGIDIVKTEDNRYLAVDGKNGKLILDFINNNEVGFFCFGGDNELIRIKDIDLRSNGKIQEFALYSVCLTLS